MPDADQPMIVGGREVKVTNLEKPFFPKVGLTKGDLLRYYVDVADAVLHHVARRPMQMKRHPNGVEGDFFYQKRVPNPHPDWLGTKACRVRETRHCDRVAKGPGRDFGRSSRGRCPRTT